MQGSDTVKPLTHQQLLMNPRDACGCVSHEFDLTRVSPHHTSRFYMSLSIRPACPCASSLANSSISSQARYHLLAFGRKNAGIIVSAFKLGEDGLEDHRPAAARRRDNGSGEVLTQMASSGTDAAWWKHSRKASLEEQVA
ncbi:hypothetical protein Scep_004512 [Stephania cephalantha]|uniref:Uncharacterized protein n=1 Tax=Stephania cephalantha TaxID=152367 RepID=A0AAP0KU09_9MAGN